MLAWSKSWIHKWSDSFAIQRLRIKLSTEGIVRTMCIAVELRNCRAWNYERVIRRGKLKLYKQFPLLLPTLIFTKQTNNPS